MIIRRRDTVMLKMMEFDKGDAPRIQHFMKVREFARIIALGENVSGDKKKLIEVAAILHDIGIHPSEEKFGDCTGAHQEQLGPIYARKLLTDLNFYPDDFVDRVCYLIGHHHTYNKIKGIDYQILVEADLLVNIYEEGVLVNDPVAVENLKNTVFKTKTGINLLNQLYGI